jgi:glycogen operon protein
VGQPDWSDTSRTLAFQVEDPGGGGHFLVMLNAYWEALSFELPELPGGRQWHRVADTSLAHPADLSEPPSALIHQRQYRLEARSSVVLTAEPA